MRTRLPEYMMKILFEWIEYNAAEPKSCWLHLIQVETNPMYSILH